MKYIGKEVHIRFLDHSQSPKYCAGPVVCNVFGVISKDEPTHFEITCWRVEQDAEGAAMNDECFTIVKGTIMAISEAKWRPLPIPKAMGKLKDQ